MEFKFSLSYDDYLQSQLYSASTEKSVKKRRLILQLILTAAYAGLAIYNYFAYGLQASTIAFLVFGVILYFAYPYYSAWSYKNVLRKRTQVLFRDYVDVENTLALSKVKIKLSVEDNVSTCSTKDVEYFAELPNHFIFKLKAGQMILLPKSAVESTQQLNSFVQSMRIEMREETNWKWK